MNFVKTYYHHPIKHTKEFNKFENIYKDRLEIFYNLFKFFKKGMNESVDTSLFPTFLLMIGHSKSESNEQSQKSQYNYYKDSNPDELQNCVDVLKSIEEKVLIQLDLYPDHATLLDVRKI